MVVDGIHITTPFGHIVTVKNNFMVKRLKDHRVNVIGFTKEACSNESELTVTKDTILKNYSIDENGTLFRVEVYRAKKFSGMVLVDFGGRKKPGFHMAYKEKAPDVSKTLF